jgi:SAM-dependent methyltransferase
VHWNVYNELYNPQGVELSNFEALPLSESFDAIWLFSVFTHLNPNDTKTMLAILRKHIRANGKLFFSAFIDEDLDDFEDRIKDKPLLNAYYGRKFMESLIEQGKWRIEGFYDKDLGNYIQHCFVCSPC